MGRHFDDWLEGYLKFVDNSEPPLAFKKWVGASTLAACLQRRCYLEWATKIYPNMYVVLVGPSGSRKGTAMGPAKAMLESLGIKLSADSSTREGFIKHLTESTTPIMFADGTEEIHSSLTIYSPELTVFLGQENATLMKALIDWWDCANMWAYRTKNSGIDYVKGVWVNLIGATTPELLHSTLPRDAVGSGLTSRVIFVYAEKKSKLVPYPVLTQEELQVCANLIKDLEYISTFQGRFTMTPELVEHYTEWYIQHSTVNAIEDPLFLPYLERRPMHLLKLSMIMNVSRTDDMIITVEDFEKAHQMLVETELYMPNVFRGFGRTPIAEMFPKVMSVIANAQVISRGDLMRRFYRDLTPDEFEQMLITLKHIGWIVETISESGVSIIKKA